MAISPLSFNIFIHALQVTSSSGDFDCNVLSTVFLSSCNLVSTEANSKLRMRKAFTVNNFATFVTGGSGGTLNSRKNEARRQDI